jgi:hypothetical protein
VTELSQLWNLHRGASSASPRKPRRKEDQSRSRFGLVKAREMSTRQGEVLIRRGLDLVPHVAGGEGEDDEEGDERPKVFGLDDGEHVGAEGEEGKGEGGDAGTERGLGRA